MKAIYSDPTPNQIIRELHCWVATYSDGTEGIIASGVTGTGMAPLISSRRDLAEAMEPLARKAQRAVAQQTPHAITSVRLVTFARIEELPPR